MDELDILQLFYDEMKNRSATRDQVFLNMEEEAAAMLSQKSGQSISVVDLQKLTDICIANQWLERTTADPNYKYLSLTEAGLQVIIANQYS
ncbi:hypothetical protein [Legionella parisiensis]|uniref:Uncharacterized protein n=1 Tax=Legionella parisiensis TaxID=45071 RepID=A0A1E5JRC0_9GAMM|nr:hypothetical protein [Legionella parisiensis]KTD44259.1 hypothetical protein Lpar_0345 [Legionella parisiensis]OEH46588.1 hypothetical protein lpari_02456 [Legionella parisiensis]STX71884.1 Uncharacterised protein [Legionella parisiensis]